MPLLEVLDLSYAVNSHELRLFLPRQKEILSGITLKLERRRSLGIVGESGSGKTTLAKCIAGLLRPTSGIINLVGLNLYPAEQNRELVRRKIQYLFQNYTSSLDPLMMIERSLHEARYPEGRRADDDWEKQAEDAIRLVELPADVLHRMPRELSGGQRQRVALARVLLADPELLILDEPASALDVLTRNQILNVIERIRRERNLTLIYISHDVSTTVSLCDQIAVLHHGQIVEYGDTHILVRHPRNLYTKQLLVLSGLGSSEMTGAVESGNPSD